MSHPDPLFILCAGRSFSSVVCGCLGQHPEMFELPEMNFFAADTIGGVIDHFYSRQARYRLHGCLRALAEVTDGEQTEAAAARAWEWMQANRAMSTADFARMIAERVAPRRIVEKSPNTVSSMDNLDRLHRAFPAARFLFLTRHPRAVGKSLHRVYTDRLQRKEARLGRRPARLPDPGLIEANWQEVQTTILHFIRCLPPGQALHLQGEELLAHPALYFRQICTWLGIRQDDAAIEAMHHPETSPFACVGPDNARFGNNPGYIQDPTLRIGRPSPQSLDGPLEWNPGVEGFQPRTQALARLLGYD